MQLDVQVNIRDAVRRLGVEQKQAAFAAVVAINRILPQAQREIVADMGRKFDRPTPYTLGGTFQRQATRARLEGSIGLKDERSAGKGTPATKYLGPSVFGGDRGEKRFERALRAAGILPQGMYAVTGSGARIDSYGNIERGQIVQILAYFQAFGEQGFKANTTDKRRAAIKKGTKRRFGFTYFVLRSPRGKLPPGVYQTIRTAFGYAVRPVLVFVDQPNYEKRFDFYGVVDRIARQQFETLYAQALQEAIATAR